MNSFFSTVYEVQWHYLLCIISWKYYSFSYTGSPNASFTGMQSSNEDRFALQCNCKTMEIQPMGGHESLWNFVIVSSHYSQTHGPLHWVSVPAYSLTRILMTCLGQDLASKIHAALLECGDGISCFLFVVVVSQAYFHVCFWCVTICALTVVKWEQAPFQLSYLWSKTNYGHQNHNWGRALSKGLNRPCKLLSIWLLKHYLFKGCLIP